MRTKLILCMGVVLASQGCGPLAHVARTTVVEPAQYPRRINDAADACADEKLAEIAWDKFQEQEPGCEYSHDFRLGFLDGYADYLYAGGTGNPPPVPPRWYWRAENENFEGHEAIKDWFAGFRKGAAMAKASGYRELVTLPFSSPPPTGLPHGNSPASSRPSEGSTTLPPPKETPPKAPSPAASPPAVPTPPPAETPPKAPSPPAVPTPPAGLPTRRPSANYPRRGKAGRRWEIKGRKDREEGCRSEAFSTNSEGAIMHGSTPRTVESIEEPAKWTCTWRLAALVLLAAVAGLQGCAALSNPVANGVPVRRLPAEQLGESRENMETIPLSLLRQKPPGAYKLASGDVLGLWIEGVLGEKGQAPPVSMGLAGGERSSIGYPIPLRADGTISLPLVGSIKVDGMTLQQAEEAIRKAYTVDKEIIKPGRERIIVTLQKKRESHILVIRQDSEHQTTTGGGGGFTGARSTGFLLNFGGGTRGVRKGTGFSIDLPAYENDVLNALARTGGFPGSDAVNEIIVERGSFEGERGRDDMMNNLRNLPPGQLPAPPGTQRIRIPLRYKPGQQPTIRPEDVILQSGDIVFIEAREADVFYAGGLLPAGEYSLPRDSDLDVIQAILRIGGPLNSGGINTANINGTLLPLGLGFPSPTLVSVVRQSPCGGQVVIRVDLDRALRDPRERILIQPKDLLILQERPEEGMARYFSQAFNFTFLDTFINNGHFLGTSGFTSPKP